MNSYPGVELHRKMRDPRGRAMTDDPNAKSDDVNVNVPSKVLCAGSVQERKTTQNNVWKFTVTCRTNVCRS